MEDVFSTKICAINLNNIQKQSSSNLNHVHSRITFMSFLITLSLYVVCQKLIRIISSISATLITATAGTCYGWPSPTLPYLTSPDSSIPTTSDEGSWIVSIMILCSALTPVPSAYFADRFGRKTTLLLGAVPFILGWVLVIFAKSITMLYVARMFSGLGYGIVYTVAPMYTGEIATNEVRGALSTLITLMNKVSMSYVRFNG